MEPMFCRVCLTTDVKLYDMSRYHLEATYEDLCGINIHESQADTRPHNVCTYCATLLNKFLSFKRRCHRASIVLKYLVTQHAPLTTDHIRSAGRNANVLLPYTISMIHNIDSSLPTEIKEENVKLNEMKSNEITLLHNTDTYISPTKDIKSTLDDGSDYDTKEFLEIDLNYDLDGSDEEPLSEKVVKKKERSVEDIIEPDENLQSIPDCGNNDFDLVLLAKEEQIAEVLTRKSSTNYKDSLYKCNYCYKGFMTQVTYNNHMVKHDPATGPVACEVCHTRWADERARKAHLLVAHERKYICRMCSHSAKNHAKAKEHVMWHRGYLFLCQLCGKSFEKSTSYLTHLRLRHPPSTVCDACGECFLGENGLNLHKKRAHRVQADVQDLECSLCSAKFKNEDALKRHTELAVNQVCDTKLRSCADCGEGLPSDEAYQEHQLMHRRPQTMFSCNGCSRTFASERQLAMHRYRANHSREPRARASWVCEMCGFFSSSHAALKKHQRVHTGEKPYSCTVCQKQFSDYQHLQIHKRTHTGERPYKCGKCPKAFQHKAGLNRHDRIHSLTHTDERPYKCGKCPKAFHNKAGLNRHDRVHTGVRPYHCPSCDKTFSQSNSMKQHVASVHLKAPLYTRKTKQIQV